MSTGPADAVADRSRRQRVLAAVASHRYGVLLVAVAACLRLIACLGYQPAIEFFGDSYDYLANARHLTLQTWHPLGYPVFLRALSWTGSLLAVPVVQHLCGLASGVLVYRLVRRRAGASDLVAAAAAAPILLDAWQLVVEHTIVAEPPFELVIVLLVTVLFQTSRSKSAVAFAGVLFAAGVLLRTAALICLPIAIGYVALSARSWRRAAAFAAVAALPLVAYAAAFQTQHGNFALVSDGSRYLYGEVATFADCSRLTVRDKELCPTLPRADRPGSNYYVWDAHSPYRAVRHLYGDKAANARAAAFTRHVISAQPGDFAHYVGQTLLHYVRMGRTTGPRDFPAETWQFPATARTPPLWHTTVGAVDYDGSSVVPRVNRPWATLLRAYQRVGFVPGPLLAVLVGVALVGAIGSGSRQLRLDILLLTFFGVALLVGSALSAGFDYRYALPTLMLVPAAAGLSMPKLRRRFWVRPWRLRPVLTVTAIAATLGLIGSNVSYANVTPVNRQLAQRMHLAGEDVLLPGGLSVRLDQPTVGRASCAPTAKGLHPVVWRQVAATITVRLLGREERLVTAGNLFVRVPGGYFSASARLGGAWLPDIVIGPAHPMTSGIVGFDLPLGEADITYTDPNGGGAATWHVFLPSGVRLPRTGSDCDPALPLGRAGGRPARPSAA